VDKFSNIAGSAIVMDIYSLAMGLLVSHLQSDINVEILRNNKPFATTLHAACVPNYFHTSLNMAHHQCWHNISHTEYQFLSIYSLLRVSAVIASHHQTFLNVVTGKNYILH
jgi:hypothetical protein